MNSISIVLGALMIVVPCLDNKNAATQSLPAKNGREQALALLNIITDPTTAYVERSAALRQLMDLPCEEKRSALIGLVINGTGELPAMATRVLIAECNEIVVAQLRESFLGWTENSQLRFFQDRLMSRDCSTYADTARLVLEHLVAKNAMAPTEMEVNTAADLAALVLAEASTGDDQALFARCVVSRPHSRCFWLAASRAKAIRPEHVELAGRVYTNTQMPLSVRFAAAIAAAPHRAEADKFVSEVIQDIVRKYGGKSLEEMDLKLHTDSANERDKQSYLELRACRRLIGMLNFLNTESAKEHVIAILSVRNQVMSNVAAYVCALRWPDSLPDAYLKGIDADQRNRLIALVDYMHKDLDAASGLMSKASDDERLRIRELQKQGFESLIALGGVTVLGL